MIGQTFAHYRIDSKLGEGGMGVVYLARDFKLERNVALKFLPESLQHNPVVRQRFVREAKSAAALDHPYVCKVFEVSKTDQGQDFIVLEYVTGRTLKELLADGQLPLREALRLAAEMAEALESAHEAGIVHRDLKPANIMVTEQGHVKVMDFGLAKRMIGPSGEATVEVTEALTTVGTTLGTLNYMSPEQVRGEALDHLTDIFSYGVILYEMVAGSHPFRRPQPMETASAILSQEISRSDPDLQNSPAFLQHIVRKSLAKEKRKRYQLIHEVKTDLTELLEENLEPSTGEEPTRLWTPPSESSRRSFWPWTLAVFMMVLSSVLLYLWAPWQATQNSQPLLTRYSVQLPETQALHFDTTSGAALAISPDGSSLAYSVVENNTTRLYLRRMNEFAAAPLLGTEGASTPFFSPDGQWVGFSSNRGLLKISIHGGTPQKISDIENHCLSASWGSAGTIIYNDCQLGLKRVPEEGGSVEQVFELHWKSTEQMERDHRSPQILPGGEVLLFTIDNSTKDKQIAVRSLVEGPKHTVLRKGTYARYVPTGHIVYAWEGDLLAVPFDLESLQVTGSPVTVLQGVMMEEGHGVAQYGLSDTGTLIYVPGTLVKAQEGSLVLVDHKGAVKPLPKPPGSYYFSPRLSPDGRHVLLSQLDELGRRRFWVSESERATWGRLTDGDEEEWWAIWNLDGTKIIYNSTVEGAMPVEIRQQSVHEAANTPLIPRGEYNRMPCSLSSDGKLLFFADGDGPNGIDIWESRLDQNSPPKKIMGSPAGETHPAIAPGGQWIAYSSDESGRWEVYVANYPELTQKTRISTKGGWEPLWAPDGRKLFYRNTSGGRVMSVTFEAAQVGIPEVLLEGAFVGGNRFNRMWDLSADGKQFLMVKRETERLNLNEIRVVQNWFEELERLVPAD